MNIAGIIWDAVNIYDGIAVEIYISGCYHNCPGCHNQEMQDFNYGKKLNIQDLVKLLEQNKDWFDIISILGGDLTCQSECESKEFTNCLKNKFPSKKLWLFTGKELNQLQKWILNSYDVIKTGKYKQDLSPGEKLASYNQKLNYKGIDY